MSTLLTSEAPPLTLHDDGSVRVAGTRFLLEVLVNAHVNRGWSAETIAAEYDTLSLADVYSSLGYYYRHRAEVEAYLARRDAEAEALKATILASQRPAPTRAELLKRRAFRVGERVPAGGLWRCAGGAEVALNGGEVFPDRADGGTASWEYVSEATGSPPAPS